MEYVEKGIKGKGGSFDKKETSSNDGATHIAAQTFTFRELAAATKNFRPECLLGEGGFGRVYKGRMESTGQASSGRTLAEFFVFTVRMSKVIENVEP